MTRRPDEHTAAQREAHRAELTRGIARMLRQVNAEPSGYTHREILRVWHDEVHRFDRVRH